MSTLLKVYVLLEYLRLLMKYIDPFTKTVQIVHSVDGDNTHGVKNLDGLINIL